MTLSGKVAAAAIPVLSVVAVVVLVVALVSGNRIDSAQAGQTHRAERSANTDSQSRLRVLHDRLEEMVQVDPAWGTTAQTRW